MAKKTAKVVKFALINSALALNVYPKGRGAILLNAETTQEDLEFLYNLGQTNYIKLVEDVNQPEGSDGVPSGTSGGEELSEQDEDLG